MKKIKSIFINLSLVFFSVFLTIYVAEKIFQRLLFSDNPAFDKWRNPGFYADPDSEDAYWKLYYLFGGQYKPPENPHPRFGWVGHFHRKTYVHGDIKGLKNKRPVLLFGDSFAMCVESSECFQDILNPDSVFGQNHYLLNYGVGGYGVDQIALLFEEITKHYEDPFVIFSIMITDLDRSLLSFRTGQKPFYKIIDDSLVLSGIPINPRPDDFIKNNPPQIKSYLYRKFLYGNSNFLSEEITSRLKKEAEYRQKKIITNEKILKNVLSLLRNRNIDHCFLIFHFLRDNNDNFGDGSVDKWRNDFLKNFLEKNEVPYIWSMNLIQKDTTYHPDDIQKYIHTGDGHPTTHFNKLISKEIKKAVLKTRALEKDKTQKDTLNPLFFKDLIRINSSKIAASDTIMTLIKKWAGNKNLSVEEMIHEFAVYCTFEGKDPYKIDYN